MDKAIEDYHEFILNDALEHIAGITSKKMFGGYGFYKDGNIFAIIADDAQLYFKADDTNKQQFINLGSEPFVYTGHKNRKPTEMPYWILPEEIMENKELLEEWVEQSATISAKNKK